MCMPECVGSAAHFIKICEHFHLEDRFAALYAVAALQVSRIDTQTVYERSVCRPQISKKCLRRSDLNETMMAREEAILRQTEL